MHEITNRKKGSHRFEGERRGIWKGLEEGKGRKKCNYTTINKKSKHSFIFSLVK